MFNIPLFLTTAPRHLFFTGKGGVGKTSLACASAVLLVDKGRRVLLVSTDPASNLDAVLGTELANRPTPITRVPRLLAMNIDPEQAARDYRERTVRPYRDVLPPQEVTEPLSEASARKLMVSNAVPSISTISKRRFLNLSR